MRTLLEMDREEEERTSQGISAAPAPEKSKSLGDTEDAPAPPVEDVFGFENPLAA